MDEQQEVPRAFQGLSEEIGALEETTRALAEQLVSVCRATPGKAVGSGPQEVRFTAPLANNIDLLSTQVAQNRATLSELLSLLAI